MRNFLAVLVFSIAIVGGLVRALAGPPPALTVKAPGIAGFEPATIHVELRVAPVESDRGIGLTLGGENFYTTHEWEGDYVSSQRIYSFDFKDVPAGNYTLTVKIGSSTAIRAIDTKQVMVQARNE